MQALLLAGGQGTRLWPLSRTETPKQLLSPLNEEKSLLIQTAERILAQGVPAENIHLVTTAAQAPLFEKSWKGFGGIIAESAARNTGPAVLLGLKYLQSLGVSPNEAIGVFASDHYISDMKFPIDIDCSRRLFCFTLEPTRPETGYGYIQLEKGPLNEARRVQAFKEKPDAPTAEAWFRAWAETPQNPENKFWNSGIFVFSVQSLLPVLQKSPEAYKLWNENSYQGLCARYAEFAKVPFDILIAEKADNLYALPLPCSRWRDIGTWKSVHEALSPSPDGNAAAGRAEILCADAKGNLAFSKEKKLIAFAGVDNLAVVDTGDALLVANRDDADAMKHLLDALAKEKAEYT